MPAKPRTVVEIALDHANYLHGLESAAAEPSEAVEAATSASVNGRFQDLRGRVQVPSQSPTLCRAVRHESKPPPGNLEKRLSVLLGEHLDGRHSRVLRGLEVRMSVWGFYIKYRS